MTVSRQAERPEPGERGTGTPAGPRRNRSRPRPNDPRARQRERTRRAIVDAAARLLRQGYIPTIAEAAEEAGVSRATAYRYFAARGSLVEAVVAESLTSAEEWEHRLAGLDDIHERLANWAEHVYEIVSRNEALVRAPLLLSLEQWAGRRRGEDLGEEPIQRGGRIPGVMALLAPLEERLSEEEHRRLAAALSVIAGVETHIVLRDIWHLDDAEVRDVIDWMARAVLAQALAAERPKKRQKPKRGR